MDTYRLWPIPVFCGCLHLALIYKGQRHRGSLLHAYTLSSAEGNHLPAGIDGPSTIHVSSCLTPAGSQACEKTLSSPSKALFKMSIPLDTFYFVLCPFLGYKFKEPTWVQLSTSYFHFPYLVPLVTSLISLTDVGLSAHTVLTARLLFDTQEGFNCFFIHWLQYRACPW